MHLSDVLRKFERGVIRKYYSYAAEPFHPLPRTPITASAEDAIKVVKSGDTIFVHSAAATPSNLLAALANHGKKNKLEKVTVCHIHIEGAMEYLKPEYSGILTQYPYIYVHTNDINSCYIYCQGYSVIIPSLLVPMLGRQLTLVELILSPSSSPRYHCCFIER